MSSTGKQVVTIHILPNISKNKRGQTKIFGKLIEYNTINIFLHISYRNEAWIKLYKALYNVKASAQHLSFQYIHAALDLDIH